VISFCLVLPSFFFGGKKDLFREREGGIRTSTSPPVRSDPLLLQGLDVTGDRPACFVEFVLSMSLRDWRDWGGVIRLGGSTDVPSEFTNGDVRMKTRSRCFATGSAKPSGGVSLLLGLPSNRFSLDGDSMGSAGGRIELFRSLR